MNRPGLPDEAHRIRAYYRSASWRASAGREYLVAERRTALTDILVECGVEIPSMSVCDIGCGVGSDLEHWATLGVPEDQLFGTELIVERARAAQRALPKASIVAVEGYRTPFADAAFDLVTASLVFSSVIDPSGRRALAAEMQRVVGSGGIIAIYDFRIRKPWNRHVRRVADRDLTAVLGTPWRRLAVSPLLPLLDVALRLPAPISHGVVRSLPRTHRIWMWRA